MLISPEYRVEQAAMHERYDYGVASVKFASIVAKVMNQYGVKELLDYGAGKCRLMKTIADERLVDHRFEYYPYEPADDRYSVPPVPREFVACIDVLEHIEPDCLEDVLDDLQRVTKEIGLFTVHCGPAAKTLSDGRNAHLIQMPRTWWLPKIVRRWDLHTFQRTESGFLVLVSPYGD